MIITEKVLIEINSRNLPIYIKKLKSNHLKIGTNEISVRDLSKGSHSLVDVKCDSCRIIKNMEWRAYLKFTKNESEIYCCKKCNNVKVRKTNLEKYGVISNSQLESNKLKVKIKSKISNKKRINTLQEKYGISYKEVINKKREDTMFEKYGVTSLFASSDFKNKRKESLLEKYGSETYNNPDKTRETRIENGTQIDDEVVDKFFEYKKVVTNRTITMYRNNQNLINPNNLKRSNKSYHIDHIFSIKQGFLINLPVEIVSHPCNLHMIHYKENLIKQDNCWIELNELLKKIISYEQELTFTHEHLRNKYSKVKEISENILSNNNI